MFRGHHINPGLVLKSKARKNGIHQGLHTDFTRTKPNENIFNYSRLGLKPLSFILSLMDNTTIVVLGKDGKPKKISIPKYHIIVMDGDCLHAGSSYENENYRIFWYGYLIKDDDNDCKMSPFETKQNFVNKLLK